MTNKTLLKYGVAGAAMLGFAVLGGQGANAVCPDTGNPANCTTQAPVNIRALITVSEDNSLDFGTITKTSTATAESYTVGTGGGMTEGNEVGSDGQANGGHAAGSYDIAGTAALAYTLTATVTGCLAGDIILSALTVDVGVADTLAGGGGVASTLPDANIPLGGTVTVTKDAATGVTNCGYTVTANY